MYIPKEIEVNVLIHVCRIWIYLIIQKNNAIHTKAINNKVQNRQ